MMDFNFYLGTNEETEIKVRMVPVRAPQVVTTRKIKRHISCPTEGWFAAILAVANQHQAPQTST